MRVRNSSVNALYDDSCKPNFQAGLHRTCCGAWFVGDPPRSNNPVSHGPTPSKPTTWWFKEPWWDSAHRLGSKGTAAENRSLVRLLYLRQYYKNRKEMRGCGHLHQSVAGWRASYLWPSLLVGCTFACTLAPSLSLPEVEKTRRLFNFYKPTFPLIVRGKEPTARAFSCEGLMAVANIKMRKTRAKENKPTSAKTLPQTSDHSRTHPDKTKSQGWWIFSKVRKHGVSVTIHLQNAASQV